MEGMGEATVDLTCVRSAGGWTCTVAVVDQASRSTHTVRVDEAVLQALEPGATDPSRLVAESFRFLLEREPLESILEDFDLQTISRYFPEYETGIRARVAGLPQR